MKRILHFSVMLIYLHNHSKGRCILAATEMRTEYYCYSNSYFHEGYTLWMSRVVYITMIAKLWLLPPWFTHVSRGNIFDKLAPTCDLKGGKKYLKNVLSNNIGHSKRTLFTYININTYQNLYTESCLMAL